MNVLNGFEATAENRLDVSAGGLLVGPGGEREDQISALAPAGAAVINACAVRLIGIDRLSRLSELASARTVKCALSPGEFVLAPQVCAVVGRGLVQVLNDCGNDVQIGEYPDNHALVAMAVGLADQAIAQLSSGEIFLGDPANIRADASEDGVRLGAGGMLGATMGAAADELNRLDLRDMQRQVTNSQLGLQRVETAAKQQQLDEQAKIRQHLDAWKSGRQAIENGDYSAVDGAIDAYNAQTPPFDDGHSLAKQSTPNGPQINHISPDGTVLASAPMTKATALQLYDEGMRRQLKLTSPTFFSHYEAAENAAKEAALGRASKEKIASGYADARRYSADAGADSRVESAGIRSEGQQGSAEIRATGTTDAARIRAEALAAQRLLGNPLTVPQQRMNESIDAARRALVGMSRPDLLKKVQPGGREFDPALAKTYQLANTRKYQADPEHDAYFGGAPSPAQSPSAPAVSSAGAADDPASRFGQDPAMRGMRLGRNTANGVEVFDQSGKHVGFYR